MTLSSQIKHITQDISEKLVALRRHLHTYPELSFEEYQTAQFISTTLTDWGIHHASKFGGGTGIVAYIGSGDRCIALRGDMDALPIVEENDVAYASAREGVMHACGHDVHMTCLLGAAYVLHQLKDQLPGMVKLIFQPGEEKLPGGASLMIAHGVLEQPRVEAVFGQHVHPDLPVGKIGYCSGSFMASADELFITIKGKGGHGAMPHKAIDPIWIACQVVQSLQSLISRSAPSFIPSVLTIGKFQSDGGATNIIPEIVRLEGTFRTFDNDWRMKAHELISNMIEHIVLAHGGSAEISILKGYPSLVNDPYLMQKTVDALKDHFGSEALVPIDRRMTAEDFAFYSKERPSCFLRLGTACDDGRYRHSVHTPRFDIDEGALDIGVQVLVVSAFSALGHP